MSNKSQLQTNNSLLSTILGIVSNRQNKEVTAGTEAKTVERSEGGILWSVKVNPTPTEDKTVTPSDSVQTVTPPAGKHLGTVTVKAVPDSEKKGLYVWKKYNYSIKPSIVANNQDLSSDGFYIFNSSDYQVTSSDFSLSILDGGQTVGTSQTIYFTYTDKLYWSYTKGGTDDYQSRTTTNDDNVLIVSSNYSCNFTGLTGIEFPDKVVGDFVDFVVSDTESAYPDGGTQDGYWYEKFNEKKIEVVSDSVNFYIGEVYEEFQKTVAHGLGRKPDYYGITSAIPGSSNILYKVSISADDTNIIFDLRYYSPYRDATFEWFAITVN